MKATKALLSIAVFSLLVAPLRAQQRDPVTAATTAQPSGPILATTGANAATELLNKRREHQLGPGDSVELRVFGEPQLDGAYEVDADGNLEVPFIDQPLFVQCRTIKDLRKQISTELAKFLRTPQVFMRVREQKSRPPAVVYGAVRSPAKFDMQRPAKLLELLSNSGGVTEQNNGTIQITHTLPQLCPDPDAPATSASQAADAATDELGIPYTIYRVGDLKAGKSEANPYIRPGDIVYVTEASPIYITGSVIAPQGIYLRDQLTLSTAMAMVGGIRREAKSSAIKVYRLKASGLGRDELVVDYKAIKDNEKEDFLLQPYDVIEVGESNKFKGKRLFETLTGMIVGSAQSIATNAPLRVLY